MRSLRIIADEALSPGLKVILMPLYSAWAIKLAIVETETNLLFATTIVLLSIYGLWVLVENATGFLSRVITGHNGAEVSIDVKRE